MSLPFGGKLPPNEVLIRVLMMEDLYGDLEDPFFSLEDVANEVFMRESRAPLVLNYLCFSSLTGGPAAHFQP